MLSEFDIVGLSRFLKIYSDYIWRNCRRALSTTHKRVVGLGLLLLTHTYIHMTARPLMLLALTSLLLSSFGLLAYAQTLLQIGLSVASLLLSFLTLLIEVEFINRS